MFLGSDQATQNTTQLSSLYHKDQGITEVPQWGQLCMYEMLKELIPRQRKTESVDTLSSDQKKPTVHVLTQSTHVHPGPHVWPHMYVPMHRMHTKFNNPTVATN
jgi:hypothetical protein